MIKAGHQSLRGEEPISQEHKKGSRLDNRKCQFSNVIVSTELKMIDRGHHKMIKYTFLAAQ